MELLARRWGQGIFQDQWGFRGGASCFMKQLKYFVDGQGLVDVASNDFEEYVSSPKCYDVMVS